MKYFLSIILSAFLIPNAFGFDASAFMMIGYGSYDKKAGAEISLGVQLRPFEFVKLDIAPMTGIFRHKDDPRYSREKNDNDKQFGCRDKTTGDFVDKKHCGVNFKYAFESSLKFQVLNKLDIGAGARVADRTLAYGVAFLRFTDSFGLEAKYGDEYKSLLLRVEF
ncbi:MAG: hypothetical protein H7177_17390 [Rhizobacter sp.]|nr:hypothetical protein [Bacteriovorax sp.]